MSPAAQLYRPITDWTKRGRAQYWKEHFEEIQTTILMSLSEYENNLLIRNCLKKSLLDECNDNEFEAFVQFVEERFTTGKLDREKIHKKDRNLSLFKQVAFWLAQMVGKEVFAIKKKKTLTSRHTSYDEHSVADNSDLEREKFSTKLAKTLCTLRNRTCAAVVGQWLHKVRGDLDSSIASKEDITEGIDMIGSGNKSSSAPTYSKLCALAYIRFLALYLETVEDKSLVEYAYFTPCQNQHPYKNDYKGSGYDAHPFKGTVRKQISELTKLILDQLEEWKRETNDLETRFFCKNLPWPSTLLDIFGYRPRHKEPIQEQIKVKINRILGRKHD
jgi:hypothetical protein